MADQLTTLAEQREQKNKRDAEAKRAKREDARKRYIPLSALIVANVIFLSLDVRAFQAIYYMTNSIMLSLVTVLISGGLAMYWFDVLYPHSKRHNNDVQKWISIVCTILAIGLSGVLAFADYVVGTGASFSPIWSTVLWASIVLLTITQGVAIAWWWSIDSHIAAEAKIQEAHAEASDQADEMAIMRTKLTGLRGVLTDLTALQKDFSPESVEIVARTLGIALPTSNSLPRPQISQQPARQFSAEAQQPQVEKAGDNGSRPKS